ncbi:MAG: ABC transporter substrate-binding protein [Burkholderiales bacterium]|nr:ABC transporter substrate-binding protein [Burkholderiales bacterium]
MGMLSAKRFRFLALVLASFAALLAHAEERIASNREIYLYQGADRAQRLISQAKKEGGLTLYTTLNLKDAAPLVEAFEKKHAVKVTLWRSGDQKVVQRVIAEARAGKHAVDVLEGNGPGMEMLYRENLLEEFYSPAFSDIPKEAFPRHRHYAPDNFLFFVMGYNTQLVKPDEVPNSYEDLLQPKWIGKLGIEESDIDWFAAVAKAMGEEKGLAYFKKLAAMKPQLRTGHTLMAELVAAGEIPIALTLYNQSVEGLKKKGAPIDWKPLPPAFGRTDGIGVARHAPHPHAALLFVDFVLSKEGQQIIHSRNRVPVSRAVESPLKKFDYRLIDLATTLDEWDVWEKRWQGLFLKGR